MPTGMEGRTNHFRRTWRGSALQLLINVKLLGLPELKPHETASETSELCVRLFIVLGADFKLWDIDFARCGDYA